ncbi:hypothetical protein P886_1776 [Alteromonadaceae bacterium 2753L.S.0a.02]|nr:hypothetical protein P886_1776 [Alteromonadaceae bacterium 2753L.S.0a.02]
MENQGGFKLVSYQVFHSYKGQPKRDGALFHLFQDNERVSSQLQGDCGSFDAQKHRIAFHNRGKAFQFCGAGAMALAENLQQERALSGQWLSIDCDTNNGEYDTYSFEIGIHDDNPSVRLTPAIAEQQTRRIQHFENCHWFAPENVFAVPLELNTLANFTVNSAFLAFLEGHRLSALLYHLNSKQQHVWFRYFTSFNNKGEDQATGSVFRYLHHILPKKDAVYHVTQLSARGANMICERQGERIIYWGNVVPQQQITLAANLTN